MNKLINTIQTNYKAHIEFYQKREKVLQLILPIYHEDGDIIEIYAQESPQKPEMIRISDHGLTLMRLSYNYDINTPIKQQIFETLLANNGVNKENGTLYLDSRPEFIYQNIMQFAGCIQKICNMRLWQKEVLRSLFFEEMKEHIENNLQEYKPQKGITPLSDYPVFEVDYSFEFSKKPLYLFGVNNKDKAKNSAIALLEFQKAGLQYISIIVHESMEELSKKDREYLTRNADKQFPHLSDFKEDGKNYMDRMAA